MLVAGAERERVRQRQRVRARQRIDLWAGRRSPKTDDDVHDAASGGERRQRLADLAPELGAGSPRPEGARRRRPHAAAPRRRRTGWRRDGRAASPSRRSSTSPIAITISGQLAAIAAADRSPVDHRHAGRCGGRDPRHRLGTERGIDRHQHAGQRNSCVVVRLGRELRGRVPSRWRAGDHVDVDLLAARPAARPRRRPGWRPPAVRSPRDRGVDKRRGRRASGGGRRVPRPRRADRRRPSPRDRRRRRRRRRCARPGWARASYPAPPAGKSTSSGATRSTAACRAGPCVASSAGAPRPGPSQSSTLSAPARPRRATTAPSSSPSLITMA